MSGQMLKYDCGCEYYFEDNDGFLVLEEYGSQYNLCIKHDRSIKEKVYPEE